MQQVRIDFDNPGLPQSLGAVEGESQSRIFQVALYKSGAAYTAPAGAVYSIMYRGFGPQNQGWYDTIEDGAGKRAACTVSGNVVTCELARQALRVPGHLTVVLCVSDAKGKMLKSWPINADVRNDGYEDTVEVESFFYITQITSADWTKAFAAWEDFKAMIDPTLTLSGKAADAKATGAAVDKLEDKKADKTALDTERKRIDTLNDGGLNLKNEVIDTSIKAWLADHPEATTTVQNGAITEEKINTEFLPYIKNDYVTPQMFGAVGDGVTDDSDSFIEALKNKLVFIPDGTYIITKNLNVIGTIIGGNETTTILKFKNLQDDSYALTIKENFSSLNKLTLISEYAQDNISNCKYNGIQCNNVWNLAFYNVQSRLFNYGMYLTNSWNNSFTGCTFSMCNTGVLCDSETNNDIFKQCFIKYNMLGIRKKDGTNFVLDGCDLSYNNVGYTQEGIGISTVSNCYFEKNNISVRQFYGIRAPNVININNCNFYSFGIQDETVISIEYGDAYISNCFFKNLGDYIPNITNKGYVLYNCYIIGKYYYNNSHVTRCKLSTHIENTKTYITSTQEGFGILTISGVNKTESTIFMSLPERFKPINDVTAYATFRNANDESIDLKFTISTDGHIYTDKAIDRTYQNGNVTIAYYTA